MARSFSPTTAEQLLAVVEAVVVHNKSPDAEFIAEFKDLTPNQTEAALGLALDMKLLGERSGKYRSVSPLGGFLDTFDQARKASVLRILLESYEPFTIFRQRLLATDNADQAAQETKTLLDLDAHRQEIKETLVSLGTYCLALKSEAGGTYRPDPEGLENSLQDIADQCGELAAAEARIRDQLGPSACNAVVRDDVIVPLARAINRARDGDGVGAIVDAANAVESFLDTLAAARQVNVAGANGINARLDCFQNPPRELPRKLNGMGRYLGQIRNAADHGTGDPDVNEANWQITDATGLEYVFVACSFIKACWRFNEDVQPPEI